MKKTFARTFGIFLILISLLMGTFNNLKINEQEQVFMDDGIVTKSLDSDLLSSEVEDLSVTINLNDETIGYDITFVDSSFDGLVTESYFLEITDGIVGFQPWDIVTFSESDSVVNNRHASNTTSYRQIIDSDTYNIVGNYQNQVGIGYTQDGEFKSALNFPLLIRISSIEDVLSIDDEVTSFSINDAKTNAEISFELFADSDLFVAEEVMLKSYSSDLNQVIYSKDSGLSMVDGINTFSLELLSEYHYYDLYLEFDFSNDSEIINVWESPIDPSIDFISGEIITEVEWTTASKVILIIVILLIIITIIFIIVILFQLKKRRELEKQQNQEYYDSNYEDQLR